MPDRLATPAPLRAGRRSFHQRPGFTPAGAREAADPVRRRIHPGPPELLSVTSVRRPWLIASSLPNTRGAWAAADGACTGHRTSGSGSRREDQLPHRRSVFPARETWPWRAARCWIHDRRRGTSPTADRRWSLSRCRSRPHGLPIRGQAGKARAGMADLTPVTSRTRRRACPPVRQAGPGGRARCGF